MLKEIVSGAWNRLQRDMQVRTGFTSNVAAAMRSQALNALYTLLSPEFETAKHRSEFWKTIAGVPDLADYLSKEAESVAETVRQKKHDTHILSPRHAFRLLPRQSPGVFYEFLDSGVTGDTGSLDARTGSTKFKDAVADIEGATDGFLKYLNEHETSTLVVYEATPLHSVTPTTSVYDIRPRAFGAGAEQLNAEFERSNSGFVVKIAEPSHVRTEADAYKIFAGDERIKAAARLLGSIEGANANVLTRIQYRRLAETVEDTKAYAQASQEKTASATRFLHAIKHAHLRQVALAHLALASGLPDLKPEVMGIKLYDALTELLGEEQTSNYDTFAASMVVDELLAKGALAPRIDPSPNNAWFNTGSAGNGSGGIDHLIAQSEAGDDTNASTLQLALDRLYISDAKRAGGLYPKYDDAIEVHIGTRLDGKIDIERVIRTCKALNAMEAFYSRGGRPGLEEEGKFLQALAKWDTPNADGQDRQRSLLRAHYLIDPEELPAADAARICAMTAIRLLRWAQKVRNAPQISTASELMVNRDAAYYMQKAGESLEAATKYSLAMTAEEGKEFTFGEVTPQKAMGYLSMKIAQTSLT